MRAFQYKEQVKLSEINRENTKILNRLVEISKGKCVRFYFVCIIFNSLYMAKDSTIKEGRRQITLFIKAIK